MMPQRRRKPDGTFTTDAIEYCDAWKEMGRPFCEQFGFRLYGFDPSFSIIDDNGEFLQISTKMMKRFYDKLTKKT